MRYSALKGLFAALTMLSPPVWAMDQAKFCAVEARAWDNVNSGSIEVERVVVFDRRVGGAGFLLRLRNPTDYTVVGVQGLLWGLECEGSSDGQGCKKTTKSEASAEIRLAPGQSDSTELRISDHVLVRMPHHVDEWRRRTKPYVYQFELQRVKAVPGGLADEFLAVRPPYKCASVEGVK